MADLRAKILIVDDELLKRTILEDELQAAGHYVKTAANPLEAEPMLAEEVFDIVVTDLRMPGQDGLSFLQELKQRSPEQGVIVMTAYGTVETAVRAMKLGAFDYLQKPFTTEELLLKLDNLLRYERMARENESLRQELSWRNEEARLVGHSQAIRKVLERIRAVAGTDSTVLIQGDSGTGKEVAARMIHQTSFRASGPFVAVSCAALPRDLIEAELFGHEAGAFTGATRQRIGRIELSHGGTLFLDDVDDMPQEAQVKLLRVLQERRFERVGGEQTVRVNMRVIAATKRPLATMVAAGQFRQDLFYRLSVVPLRMLTLRERLDDVPALVQHFLESAAVKQNRDRITISPAAVARLQAYHWPGNVRELEHMVERMVALSMGRDLTEDDVPPMDNTPDTAGLLSIDLEEADAVDMAAVLAQAESLMVRWAMERSGGNLAKAAERLGLPRSTLQYKVGKLEDQA